MVWRQRWPLLVTPLMLLLLFLVACQTKVVEVAQDGAPVAQEVESIDGTVTVAVPNASAVVVATPSLSPIVTPVEVTRIVEEVVEVTVIPTHSPTAAPAKHLTICMTHEPDSLYLHGGLLFGASQVAKQAVQHAIYENLYTTLAYGYQAQGIEKMPNLDDGDATIQSATVAAGDRVVDGSGRVSTLQEGLEVVNAAGETVVFAGSAITMTQMAVQFRLRAMNWSDGVPVTAGDSVYSFELAAHPDTPVSRGDTQRTASYVALDDLTIVWTGIPGWRDPTYFTNIWPPLPRHQLEELEAIQLLTANETTRKPLSNGPFVVTEWVEDDHIQLVRNEHYYRAAEGLPYLDIVTYKFLSNGEQLMALLLSGECDIATQDSLDIAQVPVLLDAQSSEALVPYFQTGTVFEHIDFGIDPVDDYAATRPHWFGDMRVRQALTMCTDRQEIIDEGLFGLSDVLHAYVAADHPLYPDDLTEWPYDVAQANAFLDEAGYRDSDGNGIREDPATGTPFQISLGTNAGSELRRQLTELFQANMLDCGVEVTLFTLPADEWFDPTGPLFGRRFDLAMFPWLTGLEPACDLYMTVEIPRQENGWRGKNESGWSDPDYDAACAAALDSFAGSPEYEQNHQQAMRIFAQNAPTIPLFLHLKVAATLPGVTNFTLDATQGSELYNLYEIDIER